MSVQRLRDQLLDLPRHHHLRGDYGHAKLAERGLGIEELEKGQLPLEEGLLLRGPLVDLVHEPLRPEDTQGRPRELQEVRLPEVLRGEIELVRDLLKGGQLPELTQLSLFPSVGED